MTLTGGNGAGATIGLIGTTANSSGGLTFQGSGTTTLTGISTYNGTTTVNGGTLAVTGSLAGSGATTISAGTLLLSGAGDINASSGIAVDGATAKLLQTSSVTVSPTVTIRNGGTLDGTTVVNNVVVQSGANNTIANGNGSGSLPLTIGSLNFNGLGRMNLWTSAPGFTPVAVTNLTTGLSAGSIQVNVSNSTTWTGGQTYNLLNYTNLLGGLGYGAFTKGTIAGLSDRQFASLTNLGNGVGLSIAGDTPKWTGLYNGDWTTNAIPSPQNWKLVTGLTPTDYQTGDAVLFDDQRPRHDQHHCFCRQRFSYERHLQ